MCVRVLCTRLTPTAAIHRSASPCTDCINMKWRCIIDETVAAFTVAARVRMCVCVCARAAMAGRGVVWLVLARAVTVHVCVHAVSQ